MTFTKSLLLLSITIILAACNIPATQPQSETPIQSEAPSQTETPAQPETLTQPEASPRAEAPSQPESVQLSGQIANWSAGVGTIRVIIFDMDERDWVDLVSNSATVNTDGEFSLVIDQIPADKHLWSYPSCEGLTDVGYVGATLLVYNAQDEILGMLRFSNMPSIDSGYIGMNIFYHSSDAHVEGGCPSKPTDHPHGWSTIYSIAHDVTVFEDGRYIINDSERLEAPTEGLVWTLELWQ
jgi:hypothetical protein